jgi:beta-glucanase (GH16 family)
MFTTYAGGRQTHTETSTLPFDPTADFQEYRFDYAPNSVSFYADGQLMKTWTDGLPRTSMHLMLNTWFPTWLDGRRPKKTVHTYVDWIRFVQ